MKQWPVEQWIALGRQLAEARQAVGMTQVELASELDVSKSTVKAIEHGRPYSKIQPTHRAFAAAVGWSDGSIKAVLDGGEPSKPGGRRSQARGASSSDSAGRAAGPSRGDLPAGLSEHAAYALSKGRVFDSGVISLSPGVRVVFAVQADEDVSTEDLAESYSPWVGRIQDLVRDARLRMNGDGESGSPSGS